MMTEEKSMDIENSGNSSIRSKNGVNDIRNMKIPIPSTSSIKSKKSSNILSAFVKRTRKKKIPEKCKAPPNETCQNGHLDIIASNSTLGIQTEEEVELIVENYESRGEKSSGSGEKIIKSVISSDSEHSLPPALKIKHHFFRKFMKKRSQNNKLAVDLTQELTIRSENEANIMCMNDHEDFESTKVSEKEDLGIITSIIKKPWERNVSILSDSLMIMQELTARLDESNSHLIDTLKKYLKDDSFRNELVDILTQHSKLHLEIERKTNSLTNEMWMQQVEISRKHEEVLQKIINRVVKQNRQLRIDYEIIFLAHQRLIKNEQNSNDLGLKQKCSFDQESQMEHLISHTEKLQQKLKHSFQHLQSLENEITFLQKHGSDLEGQLSASSGKIFDLEALLHRTKLNHELSNTTLKNEIYVSEKKLEEATEVGRQLMDQLHNMRIELKSVEPSIDWPICDQSDTDLVDMIKITSSAFGELVKTLDKVHRELANKNKDIDDLRKLNTSLQENLKKSTTELDILSKKVEEKVMNDNDFYDQKCELLVEDIKNLQDRLEKMKLEHSVEKNSLINTIRQYECLNNEMIEKNTMIEQTKLFINNITSENMALRNQVDGLNRLLSETGAGDVVKELSTNQEQLLYYQSQYYQLVHEKQQLKEQQELLRADNKAMLDQQETNYKHLQKQLKELESIAKDNKVLRQELELEHQTISSLQNERKKYLEEKNLLKTIFHHMKTEITRIQKLEGTVADISKEANKLAMIAEYNKQIGHKLKSEIVAKDKTILQLKDSVEKLNDIQIKNTKEKLSLCYELSEVCQIKDKLNNVLSMEVQKNADLDNSTKKIAQTASCQLRMYEEAQRKERYVLRDLVKDLKSVVLQRDTLLKEKENIIKEFEDTKVVISNHQKKIDDLSRKNHESEKTLEDLKTKYENEKAKVIQLQDRLSRESENYGDNIKQLEMLILQLREENEQRSKSIQYLQNNSQKIYKDLNESRKNVKETNDLLNRCMTEKKSIEAERNQQLKVIETLTEEKEKLAKEVVRVNLLSEKILTDFEVNIKSSMEKEDLMKKELDESKAIFMKTNRELEQISGVVAMKQEELHRVKLECTNLKQREKQHIEIIKCLENQKADTREMRNKNEKLENELIDLKANYDNVAAELSNTQLDLDKTYRQLKTVIEEKEQEYQFYKKHMDESLQSGKEIQEKNRNDLDELNMHLTDLSRKLENERSAYSALSQIHKDISAKYMKSIKDLVDEKNACQETTVKLQEIKGNLENLQSEKTDLQQQVNILLDGLNDGKNRINTLTQEKDNYKSSLDDLQKRYNDSLRKNIALENQLRGADLDKDEEYGSLKVQLESLKKECQESSNIIMALKQNVEQLSQEITNLEFQKSEVTLRLHETRRKFETEKNLCEQLKNTHMVILSTILKMKDEGAVDAHHCNNLLQVVQKHSDIGCNVNDINDVQ